MGVEDERPQRKLKLLGLHGFRTSGDILQRQLSKWGPSVHELIDLDVINGPLPCEGKSDVEGYYDGPYYEWYRFNEDFTEFYHADEAITYITDYMKLHGPYDGLIGFSQGAVLCGCLAALQGKGLALQDIPPIRFVVMISPAQLRSQQLKHIYEEPIIKCSSLALLGRKDWMRPFGQELLKSFQDPVVIEHRYGHVVPKLDETESAAVAQFLRLRLAADNLEGEVDSTIVAKEISATEATQKVEEGDTHENNTTEEVSVAVV